MSEKQIETTDKTLQEKDKLLISETVAIIMASSTITEAAEKLGISRQSLYERFERFPEIRKAVDSVKQQAIDVIQYGAIKAAQVLVDEGLKSSVHKYDIAQDILDRAGISKASSPLVGIGIKTDEMNITIE